jgi:hypothetical protein
METQMGYPTKQWTKAAAICALASLAGRSVAEQCRVFSTLVISSWRRTFALSFLTLVLCPSAAMAEILGGAYQVFVRDFDRRTFTLDVDSSDTIEIVKLKLQDKTEYLPQDQFLFYQNNFVANGRTLADYDVLKESSMSLAAIRSFDALTSAGVLTASTNPFMMRSATSGPGAGWAVFNYANAIDLSASSVDPYVRRLNPYVLHLYTVDGSAVPGAMASFDGQQSYDWTFVTATGGITGFSPEQFVFDTEKFVNPYSGTFSVVQRGDSLAISYQPVPEPSTLALLVMAAGCAGAMSLRKRRSSTCQQA